MRHTVCKALVWLARPVALQAEHPASEGASFISIATARRVKHGHDASVHVASLLRIISAWRDPSNSRCSVLVLALILQPSSAKKAAPKSFGLHHAKPLVVVAPANISMSHVHAGP